MEWADPHPWQITKRRRPRRRLEAALVGLVIAVVYLNLEPQSLDRSRHQIADTVMVSAGLKTPASQA